MSRFRFNLLDDTFFVSVIAKGVGGIIELIAGIMLFFVSVSYLQSVLSPLTHIGIQIAHDINGGSKLFVAIYFSLRGFIRVILAISLLREQLWAYPIAILLLITAIGYQSWILAGSFHTGLLLLTLFDLGVSVLTYMEYRKLRAGGHLSTPHL